MRGAWLPPSPFIGGFMKDTMGVGTGLGCLLGPGTEGVVEMMAAGSLFSNQGGVGAIWEEGGAG